MCLLHISNLIFKGTQGGKERGNRRSKYYNYILEITINTICNKLDACSFCLNCQFECEYRFFICDCFLTQKAKEEPKEEDTKEVCTFLLGVLCIKFLSIF